MAAVAGESPGEKPNANPPTEENIPASPGVYVGAWTDYVVEQAQIAIRTSESTLENAIEVARLRADRFLTTASAHFWQSIDMVQDLKSDLKSEYKTYENVAFEKIKEGFLLASSRPFITTGAVLGVGFLGLKRTRQFMYYRTMRLFFSEETLISRADAKVKELRQSIDLLKVESEKLEKTALQAEEHLVRGRTKLRQAGKQIQSAINSAYKIERQARGLKDALRELPSREASLFRAQVKNVEKEVKRERNVLSKEVAKISNHGISV